MNREVHVRVWERAEVKFLRATRQNPNASRTLVCQLSPAADIRRIGSGPLSANNGLMHRSKSPSLDQLVSEAG